MATGQQAWTMHDVDLGDDYTFPYSPTGDGIPERAYPRDIVINDVDGAGDRLFIDRATGAQERTLTGRTVTLAQLAELESWADRTGLIVLADNLGRSYIVLTSRLDVTRPRFASHPEVHDWRLTLLFLPTAVGVNDDDLWN